MIYPIGLEDNFDFGKYKGKSVEAVINEDVKYIEWCIDNVDGFELDNEAYEDYEDKLDYYDNYRDYELE